MPVLPRRSGRPALPKKPFPVSDVARIAWRGYVAQVEDVAIEHVPIEECPTLTDAVANTMGDTLQAFVLIECTEVADGHETRGARLDEALRSMRHGVDQLNAALGALERARVLEDLLDLSPSQFATTWARHAHTSSWAVPHDVLDVAARASAAQRRALAPEALSDLLRSPDTSVRRTALLLASRIGPDAVDDPPAGVSRPPRRR